MCGIVAGIEWAAAAAACGDCTLGTPRGVPQPPSAPGAGGAAGAPAAGGLTFCAFARSAAVSFLRTRITANLSNETVPVPSMSTAAYMESSCAAFSLERHDASCLPIAAPKSPREMIPSPSTSNLRKLTLASATSSAVNEPIAHTKEPSGKKFPDAIVRGVSSALELCIVGRVYLSHGAGAK